jgi:cobalamin biosynthesis protein CobT
VDLIQDFSGHNHDDNEEVAALLGSKDEDNEAAVDKAIVQASHFDEPSATVYDIRVFTWPKDDKRSEGWEPYYSNENLTLRIGDKKWSVLQTPEEVLQPALFEMRRVFSDNRRGRYDRNLKRGKLDGRALGRRAWKADDDPRLFKKMERPAKRSYAVIMAGDASTSANNGPLVVEKQAMLAQAELCHRIGIDFEVWFHTADQYQGSLLPKGFDPDYDDAWTQDMYRVKEWREPWTDQAREGLAWMRPVYTNLDGHNLEFLRKRLMASEATTKILLYYTDGEMPAANYQDELETLQREVDLYKRAGIIMLGVGVGTDSPSKWGMDTVRINHKGDVGKVIKHLERRLIMA